MFEKEAEEYVKHWIVGEDENALMQEAFKDGAEFGYNKANEYAKTIIQDLLNNSDEYARERAMDFLEEKK
jgi:hypothetical protein